jgi:hypothetical protein
MKRPKSVIPKMDRNIYPPGWNRQRANAVAKYYDARKDQPIVALKQPPASAK